MLGVPKPGPGLMDTNGFQAMWLAGSLIDMQWLAKDLKYSPPPQNLLKGIIALLRKD